MQGLLNELLSNSKISQEQHDALVSAVRDLQQNPTTHQKFLEKTKQFEPLAGGKIFAYCMLIAGYAAMFCTGGLLGQRLVDDAKKTLEQIDIVEGVVSEAVRSCPRQ